MDQKAADQAAEGPQDKPADSVFVQLLKFFDRHNGAFNALAAIAVAFFTWRLWRLSVKEIDALGQQSADVERSIAESARSAAAMESVAGSMAISAAAAEASVVALKERTAQQMRAYVTVLVGAAVYQERDKGIRFEAKPFFLNTGATPAHKLRYRATAAIRPFADFNSSAFPLPPEELGGATLNAQQSFFTGSVVDNFIPDQDVVATKNGNQQALFVWGVVTYEDIFGAPHKTEYAIIYRWLPDGNVVGHWARHHNESD